MPVERRTRREGAPARELVRRVALVLPARDEEPPLPLVLAELPPGRVDRLIVVDVGSRDRTAEVASAAGAEAVREPRPG